MEQRPLPRGEAWRERPPRPNRTWAGAQALRRFAPRRMAAQVSGQQLSGPSRSTGEARAPISSPSSRRRQRAPPAHACPRPRGPCSQLGRSRRACQGRMSPSPRRQGIRSSRSRRTCAPTRTPAPGRASRHSRTAMRRAVKTMRCGATLGPEASCHPCAWQAFRVAFPIPRRSGKIGAELDNAAQRPQLIPSPTQIPGHACCWRKSSAPGTPSPTLPWTKETLHDAKRSRGPPWPAWPCPFSAPSPAGRGRDGRLAQTGPHEAGPAQARARWIFSKESTQPTTR